MMRRRNETLQCTFLRNLASHSEMLSLAIFNILVQWAFGILWQKAQIRGVQMFLWPFDTRETEFVALVSVDQKNINNFINLIYYLLSHFSHVQLCATPWMAAHQATSSLGFSRQEHWSGLPFPSPMHQSEKWKWSRSVVSNPQRPHGLQPSRLLRPWHFPGNSTGVGCHCLLRYTT